MWWGGWNIFCYTFNYRHFRINFCGGDYSEISSFFSSMLISLDSILHALTLISRLVIDFLSIRKVIIFLAIDTDDGHSLRSGSI